jgi:uncharacterized protein (DUF2461 family)
VAEAFTGFPPSGVAFLAGLAADNTKAYFDGNRGTYANDVAAPLRALVIAVGQRLRDGAGQHVCFEPAVGKSLFRINRDTASRPIRLRTTRGSMPSGGPDSTTPAFIFRLSAGGLVAGAGITGLRDTHLDRYRTAVADDSSVRAPHDLLNQLSATLPDVEITEPARKRVPAPYPQDHLRRDLLRCDSLHASVQRDHPRTLAPPQFADTLTGLLTPFAQLHRWLVDHVTT